MEEYALKEILSQFAEVKELKIIKGDNNRGKFDLFCYAFVTFRGTEASISEVIRKLHDHHPTWKMNIKMNDDKFKNSRPMQGMGLQGNMPKTPKYLNTSEKIVGEKPCNIMVRELWLGGIPENMDRAYMGHVMSHFGMVEDIELFPKFSFIKFKMVQEATLAFERAQQIANFLGNPPGFRIYFSDPLRRAHIVSNNYEFDRQSPSLPILFLGFPPVTSANVDLQYMRSICEKYGQISNAYMRKNTNTQNRSYIMFTYTDLKQAIRAKGQLCKRRDLLGDKRVEATLLIDEQVIMKGRDFSYTMRMFQSQLGMNTNSMQSKKGGYHQQQSHQHSHHQSQSPHQQHYYPPPQDKGMMHQPQPYQMYPPPMYQPPFPMYYPPPNASQMYYPGEMPYPPKEEGQFSRQRDGGRQQYRDRQGDYQRPDRERQQRQRERERERERQRERQPRERSRERQPRSPKQAQSQQISDTQDIHQFLKDVLGDPTTEKKPTRQQRQSNAQDIISKLLGNESIQKQTHTHSHKQMHSFDHQERQPSWSGFLTWKGYKRVAVDGHSTTVEPEDYAINIVSLLQSKDVLLKDKNIMVLSPSNSISLPSFKEYLKMLKNKVGVSFNSQFLMYIMAKSEISDSIEEIREGQLLIVLEKASLLNSIRDKLIKCEDMP